MDSSPSPRNQDLDATDAMQHLRSEPRDSMFLLAAVRRAQGTEVSVKVRNLSPGGLMAECPGGFVRGEVIEVDLRGIGPVGGRVAWTASGRIGIKFDEPVDHRRARLPVGAGPKMFLADVGKSTWRPAVR